MYLLLLLTVLLLQQAKTAAGLKELRNKSIFFFSVFNALFVLIVFMLTLHKDTLHIDWPWGVKENTTITEDERVINHINYLIDLLSLNTALFLSLHRLSS